MQLIGSKISLTEEELQDLSDLGFEVDIYVDYNTNRKKCNVEFNLDNFKFMLSGEPEKLEILLEITEGAITRKYPLIVRSVSNLYELVDFLEYFSSIRDFELGLESNYSHNITMKDRRRWSGYPFLTTTEESGQTTLSATNLNFSMDLELTPNSSTLILFTNTERTNPMKYGLVDGEEVDACLEMLYNFSKLKYIRIKNE